MIEGQILTYWYNNFDNAKPDLQRNKFRLENVSVENKDQFAESIMCQLDDTPPGKGYVLVKWNNRLFKCELDINNKESATYIRRELKYHPLMDCFKTI